MTKNDSFSHLADADIYFKAERDWLYINYNKNRKAWPEMLNIKTLWEINTYSYTHLMVPIMTWQSG